MKSKVLCKWMVLGKNNTLAAKTEKLMYCKSNFTFYANMGTHSQDKQMCYSSNVKMEACNHFNRTRTLSELFIREASQPGETMNGRQGFTTIFFFLFDLPMREGLWEKRISCANQDVFPDYKMRIRLLL